MKLKSKFIIFLIFSSFFFVSCAQAATLNISSVSKTYNVGDTINLSVVVGSGGESINAVSSTLLFPKNLVTVTSISKTNTIINFWVTEPSFSNTEGIVPFEGVILNPGFSGTQGQILKVVLKAKQAGKGNITLSNASVLANDGSGTNVLENIGQFALSIGNGKVEILPEDIPAPVKITQTPQKGSLPPAPVITSETVPDQTLWYMTDNVKVNWQLPKNVTKVFASLDKNEKTVPRVLKTGSQISFERNDLASGVWYIHVRFKNSVGYGPTASFKVNLDTIPPEIFILGEVKSEDNTKASFNVSATDALSGIDKYLFTVDNGKEQDWIDDENHIFTTETLAPGTHTITGAVYDKAGNKTTSNLNFTTEGVLTPKITSYSESFKETEQYKIEGSAYPESKIKVFVDNADSNKPNSVILEGITRNDGHFSTIGQAGLPYGTYDAYAKSYLGDIESLSSNKVRMISKPTGFHLTLSIIMEGLNWIVLEISKYLMFIMLGLAFIILLIFIMFMLRYKKRHSKIVSEPPARVSPSVDFGRKDSTPLINHTINTQLAILGKINSGKNFTPEELHFLSQLQRDLNYLDIRNTEKDVIK
jgi:hypothetical protein